MQTKEKKPPFALAIHGGAGTILKSEMTPNMEQAYRQSLDRVLEFGQKMLSEGKPALDVVEAVVILLEDDPLFNAGKGAVFSHDGKNELDASIMEGKTLKAGAIAGVTTIKNPITLARAVMEKSDHVMLAGAGAEQFAREQGITVVDPSYFFTQNRWDALQKVLARENQKPKTAAEKHGTVGCVAMDKDGNLAAATSTGGMTAKRWNRIGDAPVIGAGTYADNSSCAVSCTGHGEYFIRHVAAFQVAALVKYKGMNAEQAGNEVIHQILKPAGGDGGLICVDKNGNIALPYNSEGMYRGYATPEVRKAMIWQE